MQTEPYVVLGPFMVEERVAAGGTERQFPRSKHPWNPRP